MFIGKHYHLHREFIVNVLPDEYEALLCSTCLAPALKGNLPKTCVARGDDYGNLDKIPGYSPLTYVEELMISRYVSQVSLWKLTLKGRGGSANDQLALKGHTITFPHNGLENLTAKLSDDAILPRTSLMEFFNVTYIGRAAFIDDVKTGLKSTRTFRICKARVMCFLAFLKACNPYYSHITLNQDWDEKEVQDSIHADIISNMETDDSPHTAAVDEYTSQNIASDTQPPESFSTSTGDLDCQAVMVACADVEGTSTLPAETDTGKFAAYCATAFRESGESLERDLANEVCT
jgi:hypothetical protein